MKLRLEKVKMIKIFGLDFLIYLLENKPRIYSEAMSCTEAFYCMKPVDNEIESIMNNHTWKPVDLSPKSKSLCHKWIFKRKIKVDGTIDKYKATLVVKGFKQ